MERLWGRGSAVLFVLVVIGYGGCADNGVNGPPPLRITSDWLVTAIETTDTCGFSLPPTFTESMDVYQRGLLLRLNLVDALGSCQTYAATITDNTVTYGRTGTFTEGACTLNLQEDATSTYTASATHFDGTDSYHFTYLSGDCAGLTSCDWILSTQGDRCSNCGEGCNGGATP